MRRLALTALALGLLALGARAEDVRIELSVTSVAGSAVYVDRGTAGGLETGDRVEFRLPNGALATGVVRSAGPNSARIELDPGSLSPRVGATGTATVPDTRPGAQEPRTPAGPPAERPPWTHPPETWSEDRPLLAPAFSVAPEDRAPRWRGRAWLRFDGTFDREREREYSLLAVGADATLENPFGDGGSLRIGAEGFARQSDLEGDLFEYDDARLRLDRLVYQVGGTEDRPHRFLVGRFLQDSFPELGVLDGAEWSVRTRGGTVIGASLGYSPEPFADFDSFEDLQAAVSVRQLFASADVGLAYQNTWHEGTQDRNLFVLDAGARPTDRLSLRASAWIDVYGGSDTLKDDGVELTEGRLSGTYTADGGHGVSAFVLQRRIPELLRDEFLMRRADDVQNLVVDRAGINAWTRAGRDVRLDARVEGWDAGEDDGWSAEVGGGLDGALGGQSSLYGALSWAQGAYSSGPGARIDARRTFGTTSAGLGWRAAWYEHDDFGGDEDELAQHAVYGSLDLPLWGRCDLSLTADRSFGDGLDAWAAGILLQARF
ncbi:MAG: hypothetical protein JNK02_06550 [Planctomycetes bacterium]|nr:hypothetical protein [Planctomycetota bacterium]